MDAEHPFTRIPLEDGEQLLFKTWNPTFHRSFDFAIAASDRALYIRRYRPFMPAWKRFDISKMKGLTLKPAPSRPYIPIGLTVSFAALIVAGNASTVAKCCRSTSLLAAVGVLFAAFFVWVAYTSVKSIQGRTDLLVELENRSVSVRTPVDAYTDEKEFDRKMMREALAVIQQRGVPVSDKCPAPNSTPQDGPAASGRPLS